MDAIYEVEAKQGKYFVCDETEHMVEGLQGFRVYYQWENGTHQSFGEPFPTKEIAIQVCNMARDSFAEGYLQGKNDKRR